MAAVQKDIIHVKHVFKPHNIPNDTYSLCLCEIFTINFAKQRHKSPGLEMLKNVMGFDVVTETCITLTLPWDGAPPRKGPPGGQKPRKPDSSLSGHWMGHLLSYSLSGGHDGSMLPINLRGLNGPLTSQHDFFLPHAFFTKYTNTLLISNAKLIKWVVERL